jgi:hypothetical protein
LFIVPSFFYDKEDTPKPQGGGTIIFGLLRYVIFGLNIEIRIWNLAPRPETGLQEKVVVDRVQPPRSDGEANGFAREPIPWESAAVSFGNRQGSGSNTSIEQAIR